MHQPLQSFVTMILQLCNVYNEHFVGNIKDYVNNIKDILLFLLIIVDSRLFRDLKGNFLLKRYTQVIIQSNRSQGIRLKNQHTIRARVRVSQCTAFCTCT